MRVIATFLRYIGYINFIKRPYKSCFIANSSSFTTTELSIFLTSCLNVIKNHVIKHCENVLRGMVEIYFGLPKIRCDS